MLTTLQRSDRPLRKVSVGGVRGLAGGTGIAVVLVWGLRTQDIEMPIEIAIVIGGWIGSLTTTLSAYFTKERA